MKRADVLSILQKNRSGLAKFGVKSLSLFGSVARDEAKEDSDIDFLVEFKEKATFDRFMNTKFFLEDLLGVKVDLVMPQAIRERTKAYIMEDLIRVA